MVAPAAAFSRGTIAESRRKSGIDCRFAASFASKPETIGISSAGRFRANLPDYFAWDADDTDAQSAARSPPQNSLKTEQSFTASLRRPSASQSGPLSLRLRLTGPEITFRTLFEYAALTRARGGSLFAARGRCTSVQVTK